MAIPTDNELERVKDADEIELENTIRRLLERLGAAREGSAEYRMIERQLEGVRSFGKQSNKCWADG
jgi:hypothetical protein